MRLLIINNLNSGYGEGSVYDFIRSFAKENDELIVRNVIHTTDMIRHISDARQFDMVVAAGDDDTISKISFFLANSQIPILPYPSGTANLIAQNLFLPSEPHALAKMARERKTMNFDVGQITAGGKKWGFGCNAAAGYITKIGKDAMATRKSLGPFAYLGAALSNYKPQFSKFEIELKNRTIKTEGIGIMLLNFAKIGLDLSVTHNNKPRDGRFEIVVLKAKTALRYVPALSAAALDKAIEFPDRSDALEIYQSSYVKINAEPQMEIQLDGKSINLNTPFEAKILKHAARYVVDDECFKNYATSEKEI